MKYALPLVNTQRATSTKTRIKTSVNVLFKKFVTSLKEQLPLKQGLRQGHFLPSPLQSLNPLTRPRLSEAVTSLPTAGKDAGI